MPIESRAVCAKSLTPQKSGHQRKTGHSLVQNGPRMMERGQYPPWSSFALRWLRLPLVDGNGSRRPEPTFLRKSPDGCPDFGYVGHGRGHAARFLDCFDKRPADLGIR